ncbi:hypothetical protein HYDPIDRAFT_94825 [Hydnomerulius pinastri MD-312]|uniref:Methyltransferase domain-containing protein n=1 Tax=Hydnomerulius pinastri MD-312 TaxID=994086 RepID=A0A0C9W669_9AGAM|nr:hypothetical protein HYDPIDRAFT_94825 [Hydnomerulius pinastri MD-312]
MSPDGDHILREQHPNESLIPALDSSLFGLSEEQKAFLLHAIRDLDQGVGEEEITRRVLEAQSDKTYPYPCIRAFHHVSLFMAENTVFGRIRDVIVKPRQDESPLLLDIGCCMGTDLRYLAYLGYPPKSLIGCDVRGEFIELGYKLYSDRDKCEIPFFVGDIFDIELRPFPQQSDSTSLPLTEVSNLNQLRGRVKYIYAGALFHLFDEGTQEAIARRLASLLDVRGGESAVVFGRHSAQEKEGMIDDSMGRVRYAHSPDSWERLWKRRLWKRVAGDMLVSVEADLRTHPSVRTKARGTRMMWWSVCIASRG